MLSKTEFAQQWFQQIFYEEIFKNTNLVYEAVSEIYLHVGY